MKVAVVGAGAMGCLFGGRLAETGHDVVLVEVSDAQIGAIRDHGLRLEDDDGDRRIPLAIGPARNFADPRDLVIVFTKGMHTRAAVAEAVHLVGSATWIVTVQNGLGNAQAIRDTVRSGRVAFGMTNWPADLAGPGHVRSHGGGQVRLWTDRRHEGELGGLVAALDGAGLACIADPEVEVAIWEKVAFNAAMNSVAAVSRLDVGGMADRPDARALVAATAAETLAVAAARNLAVDPARVNDAIAHAFAHHRGHKPSMLQDVLAGRPTEIESINGQVCAEADRLGVPVPVTRTLLQLARALTGHSC